MKKEKNGPNTLVLQSLIFGAGSVKSELLFKVDWKWSVEDNILGWLGQLLAKQAKRNFILQHSQVIYAWLIPTDL